MNVSSQHHNMYTPPRRCKAKDSVLGACRKLINVPYTKQIGCNNFKQRNRPIAYLCSNNKAYNGTNDAASNFVSIGTYLKEELGRYEIYLEEP